MQPLSVTSNAMRRHWYPPQRLKGNQRRPYPLSRKSRRGAHALLTRSSIIILDEATSSIDFATDAKIQSMIRHEYNDSLLALFVFLVNRVIDVPCCPSSMHCYRLPIMTAPSCSIKDKYVFISSRRSVIDVLFTHRLQNPIRHGISLPRMVGYVPQEWLVWQVGGYC